MSYDSCIRDVEAPRYGHVTTHTPATTPWMSGSAPLSCRWARRKTLGISPGAARRDHRGVAKRKAPLIRPAVSKCHLVKACVLHEITQVALVGLPAAHRQHVAPFPVSASALPHSRADMGLVRPCHSIKSSSCPPRSWLLALRAWIYRKSFLATARVLRRAHRQHAIQYRW